MVVAIAEMGIYDQVLIRSLGNGKWESSGPSWINDQLDFWWFGSVWQRSLLKVDPAESYTWWVCVGEPVEFCSEKCPMPIKIGQVNFQCSAISNVDWNGRQSLFTPWPPFVRGWSVALQWRYLYLIPRTTVYLPTLRKQQNLPPVYTLCKL